MSKYVFIFLSLLSTITQAQWFESSATAVVIDGDWDNARERALKKAVKSALTFSGGAISSLQQVSNGVLVENKLILNSEGEIKALIITDEQQLNKSLKVSIRVDIQAPEKVCYGSRFPKSIAVTRFKLNTPDQASEGRIFSVNKQITKTLFNQLKLSPQSLNVRQLVDSPMKLATKRFAGRS